MPVLMKFASVLLLASLTPNLLLAEEKAPFQNFPKEQFQIWTSPFRLERKQVPWLVAFGVGAAALIAADKHISNGLPNSNSQILWGTRISRVGSSYGILGLGAGMFAVGAIGHDSRLKRTGIASMESLGHSLVLTYGLKLLTSRERPGTGSGQGHFWSGYGDAFGGNKSFPSGHSMESWAIASVVAHEYRDKRYVPWIAYGLASMVSASRVAAQRHYASDVAVGAAAGYLIGKFVQGRYAAQSSGSKHGWLRPAIQPIIQPASGTMALSLSFSLTKPH